MTDEDVGLGAALAGFGALVAGIVVGVLLTPVRETIGLENVTIVFVAITALAGAAGGRVGGLVAAAVSALSYNFFFTTPYQSLRIDSAEQVVTVVLLFVAGLAAGLAGDLVRRAAVRRERAAHRDESLALEVVDRALRARASGEDPATPAVDGLQLLLRARWVAVVDGTGAALAAAGRAPAGTDPRALPEVDPAALLSPGTADATSAIAGFRVPAAPDRWVAVVPGHRGALSASARTALGATALAVGAWVLSD